MMKLLQRLNFIKPRESGPQSGLTPAEEQYVLARAYVPEHIPSLMGLISQSRPFLLEDYLGFVKDNWLILVGYPLEEAFSPERCEQVVAEVIKTYYPEHLWFIGSEVPVSLLKSCNERQTDDYYRLDLEHTQLKPALRRVVRKAAERLTVEKTRTFGREHRALVAEFRQQYPLPPLIEALYDSMPAYLAHSTSACLLNARDEQGQLAAFYVVELAAPAFDTYVLGCYSRQNYVPHASDLLFFEMIKLARARGKTIINLGLGVNAGIRRFKTKWGGVPFLKYEFCAWHDTRTQTLSLIDTLLAGKR